MESSHTTTDSTVALATQAEKIASARLDGDLSVHAQALRGEVSPGDDSDAYEDVSIAVSALVAARVGIACAEKGTADGNDVYNVAATVERDYLNRLKKTGDQGEPEGLKPGNEESDVFQENLVALTQMTIDGIDHFSGKADAGTTGTPWQAIEVARAARQMADFQRPSSGLDEDDLSGLLNALFGEDSDEGAEDLI